MCLFSRPVIFSREAMFSVVPRGIETVEQDASCAAARKAGASSLPLACSVHTRGATCTAKADARKEAITATREKSISSGLPLYPHIHVDGIFTYTPPTSLRHVRQADRRRRNIMSYGPRGQEYGVHDMPMDEVLVRRTIGARGC